MDIQYLLSLTSNTLALVLLQKLVHIKNVMRELKQRSEGENFIKSVKTYGSKRNLDLKATFKFV